MIFVTVCCYGEYNINSAGFIAALKKNRVSYKIMTTDNKTENPEKKQNRDFERRGVYTPENSGFNYNNYNDSDYNRENKFRFRNSLVITPFYETEFDVSGGIKYIQNHDGCVFFEDDRIFATTNNIQKLPVLIKRGLNKQPVQKKLTVGEKYNYEEKYEIYKNIILYYEENRIDFQIMFNKLDSDKNTKDITTEFYLSLSVPGMPLPGNIITYKKYNEKHEYKSSGSPGTEIENSVNLEYIAAGLGKSEDCCMTLYPGRNLLTGYKDKSLTFTAPNISHPQKNYINLKIYLENYRIT